MSNRCARSRQSARRVFVAALLAIAVAILGLPAAASADTLGTAVLKIGSQITVTSSANPTAPNTDVTLTATFAVIAGNSDVAPTGQVTFLDDGVTLGVGDLSGQSASWTGQLPLGTHPISASYAGDDNYTADVSDPLALNVAYIPALSISVAGGNTALPNDGSWSPDITVGATSDPAASDLPHTRFTVDFSGISGMAAAQLGLQEDTGGTWVDVPLTDQAPGDVTADLGGDSDLSPGSSTDETLRLRAVRGAQAGTLTMAASLLSSPDGVNWSPAVATADQTWTVQPGSVLTPTTTTVTASNVVTDTDSAPVTITANVTPSAATGTVTFLDNGNPVGAAALSNGKATVTPSLGLGYHGISASYSGDSNYATSTGAEEQQVSVSPPGGSLHAITPVRMLDTRPGRTAVFTPGTKIAAGKSMNLQITGEGGIPATGVAGISVNITVVQPAATGYVTIYPTGGAVPGTANIDFPQGANTAGLVITDVGASGQITILNKSNGPIDAIADVSAWFAQQTSSFDGQGRYNAVVPFRLLDTRKTLRMKANTMVPIPVAGVGSIPKTGVEAVMLNVTSVNPSAAAYLVLYPGGAARPLVSTTAFQKAETRAGRVIVGVGSDGTVDLYNSPFASTDVVVDIAGWFTGPTSTAGGATFVPLTVSQRLTPAQTGGSLWGSGAFRAVQIAGVDGIPKQSSAIHASAVVGNLHVSAATTGGYLTAYPLALRPTTSDLNFVKGAALQNLSIATLGSTGAFNLYNYNGSATVTIDIYGWFG